VAKNGPRSIFFEEFSKRFLTGISKGMVKTKKMGVGSPEENAAIRVIENTIRGLEAYKTAVIREAVLEGIKSPRLLKESGRGWLGRVNQWSSIVDLGRYCDVDLHTESSGRGEVNDRSLVVMRGDQEILVRMREADPERDGIKEATVKVGREFNGRYLFYQLGMMDYSQYLAEKGQRDMSLEMLREMDVVMPPISEQRRIAEYLDQKVGTIDLVVRKYRMLIDAVQKYKKRGDL
jgi:hypothetical protein